MVGLFSPSALSDDTQRTCVTSGVWTQDVWSKRLCHMNKYRPRKALALVAVHFIGAHPLVTLYELSL
jgi:hypothetical protein